MRPTRSFCVLIAFLFILSGGEAGAQQPSAVPAATSGSASPATKAIEEQWGIRILGIRLTAASYMLDFRYVVTDPAKAKPLFVRGLNPVLRHEASGAQFIVPAPPKLGPMRSTNVPQAGRTYFMFFANPGTYVKAGQRVTVNIGDFKVEHLPVMAESEPFPAVPPFNPELVVVEYEDAGEPDAAPASLTRARPVSVDVPVVELRDQDGKAVKLREWLSGGPAILNFMYTSCKTTCPAMAGSLAGLQRELGDRASELRIVSVSIDPDADTPERRRAFLEERGVKQGWRFVAGSQQEAEALQRAFNVYRGPKTNHPPAYFITDGEGSWSRVGGIAGAEVLAGEVARLTGIGREE